MSRLRQHGDEIALGAGGDEERRFLSRAARGLRLEPLDGRVLLPDVVPDLRAGHGLAHGRRGLGQGVGAEVDDVVHAYLVAAVRSRCVARFPHSV